MLRQRLLEFGVDYLEFRNGNLENDVDYLEVGNEGKRED